MQHGFDSQPAAPVGVAISEPPIAPVALSFDSSPTTLPSRAARSRPSASTAAHLLSAWAIDLFLLGSLFFADVVVATQVAGSDDVREMLARAAWLWIGLAAVLAVAWSWIFVALGGRTPGMAFTGRSVRVAQGGRPTTARALVRAIFAVAFAVPGLFGFVLALFDGRGQTLHDKLCRCVTVVD